MSLIVGATPFSQWERLEPFFQQLGWGAQSLAEPALSSTIAASSSPCLLLHTRPEVAVARALEQGQAPWEALEQWQNTAQTLLAVLRANRSRCLMVEVNSAIEAPERLLDWLKNNRPSFLSLPSDIGSLDVELKAPEAPNDRDLLLATQLVAQSETVQTILAPLEASTVPLSEDGYTVPAVNIDQLRQQWQQEDQQRESLHRTSQESQSSIEAEQAKVATLENKVGELERELASARKAQQENAAALAKATAQASTGSQSQQAERARLERDVQTLSADKSALEKQSQETLNQLFKVQEELEKYHIQNKELKEQLRVANRDLTQTLKKLHAIEASPFWRITAPARRMLGFVKQLLRKAKRSLARR